MKLHEDKMDIARGERPLALEIGKDPARMTSDVCSFLNIRSHQAEISDLSHKGGRTDTQVKQSSLRDEGQCGPGWAQSAQRYLAGDMPAATDGDFEVSSLVRDVAIPKSPTALVTMAPIRHGQSRNAQGILAEPRETIAKEITIWLLQFLIVLFCCFIAVGYAPPIASKIGYDLNVFYENAYHTQQVLHAKSLENETHQP